MFEIDFDKLLLQNTPESLQKNKFIALLLCLIGPIKLLYNDFKNYRKKTLMRLNYTGQTIYLIRLLEDTYNLPGAFSIEEYLPEDINIYLFDPTETGIPVYLFDPEDYEADPTLPISYLYDIEELIPPIDFKVFYPDGHNIDANGLKALISKFKLADKNFDIEVY